MKNKELNKIWKLSGKHLNLQVLEVNALIEDSLLRRIETCTQ